MTAIQALMERELGHLALELLEERDIAASIIPAAEKRALGLVQAIQAVLDDPALSDFQCVDEIAGLLRRAGIPTSRHD